MSPDLVTTNPPTDYRHGIFETTQDECLLEDKVIINNCTITLLTTWEIVLYNSDQ